MAHIQNQTPDDALEPKSNDNGLFNPRRDEPHLAQDYDTPAKPADDTHSKPIPADHPATDSHIDEQEIYDEGLADAAIDNRDETQSEPPKRIA